MASAPKQTAFAASRDALLEKGEHLKRMLGAEQGQFVEEKLHDLRMNRFSVAVIGEIKAGKSSFLNALIGRPDYLPTDVNPWTTVITHLHFGRADGRTTGAEFTFFSQDDWQRLVKPFSWRESIRRRMNTLGQILSGKAPDEEAEWERQREEIARRATERLGEDAIQRLLGTKRLLQEVRPKELEDYLTEKGKYAFITKEAEIFFPRPPHPFEESFALVDTPGTNDPCRMREEQTLQYLDRADAYVLVIRATAAMQATTVELLRNLIVGLHKSRLIIFVNWIDVLGSPVEDVQKVKDHVLKALKKYFPSVEIPVLSGSARWCQLAFQKDVSRWIDDFRWKSFTAYVRSRGWFSEEQIKQWRKEAEDGAPESIRRAIWKASGIYDVRRTIQSVLLREKGRALLKKSRDVLQVQAEHYAAVAARAAEDCERTARIHEDNLKSAQRKLEELRQQMERQQEQLNHLQQVQVSAASRLRESIDKETKQIGQTLEAVVREFAAKEKLKLEGANTVFGPDFQARLDQCRSELQDGFLREYAKLRDLVKCEQAKFLQRLREALAKVDGELAENLHMIVPEEIDPAPALSGISRTVTIEFDFFYRIIGHFFEGKKGRSQELYEQIVKAFVEPLEGLTVTVHRSIQQALGKTLEQMDWAVSQGVQQVETRRLAAARQYEQIERGMKPQQVREIAHQSRRSAERHRQKAGELDSLAREIVSVPLPLKTGK